MTEPIRSPFSLNIPQFQVAWDSTSLGWLKSCPQLYAFNMLEGWTSRSRGVHLHFGGLYASGEEHYAKRRAAGLSHDDALLSSVRTVLLDSGTRDAADVWHPWVSDIPEKNLYTLVRSLVWNLEERLTSPFSTLIRPNGEAAVELTFNFTAFEIGGEQVSLSGHMDEIVEADDRRWVRDSKTTKSPLTASYRQHYSPDNQMSLYSIAGKVILNSPVSGVLVRAAQIGVGFTRFQTFQVPRPTAVLDEWMRDTEMWIASARDYALRGVWPKNDKACQMFGGCAFAKVCSVSPVHRKSWLESDFIQRPPEDRWNPLRSRSI